MKNNSSNHYSQEVMDFVKVLLHNKGMDKMPAEILKDMMLDLYLRLENWLMLDLMNVLDEKNLKEFDEFAESQDDPMNLDSKELRDFLELRIPNLNEVIENSMKNFSEVYLSGGNLNK